MNCLLLFVFFFQLSTETALSERAHLEQKVEDLDGQLKIVSVLICEDLSYLVKRE